MLIYLYKVYNAGPIIVALNVLYTGRFLYLLISYV